jgi:hypothetical protein
MPGAERQRRYWRRLRARLAPAASPSSPPLALTHRPLVWHEKAWEATGTASDTTEYIVARVPDTDEFELNFYDEAGDFLLLGDGFHSMAEAEQAAEQHNAERFLQNL